MKKSTTSRTTILPQGRQRLKPRKDPGPFFDDDRDDGTTDWPPVKDSDLPIDIILARLKCVRATSTGYVACCPSHHDSRPSLSISETTDRDALLHCFSSVNCNAASIMAAIGLTENYLFATMTALLHAKKNGTKPVTTAAAAKREAGEAPDIDPALAKLAKKYRKHPDADAQVFALSKALGVAMETLEALGVGWTGSKWSIPERDHLRHVVGIAYRDEDGRKRFEEGGHRGLIIPANLADYDGTLYIPEGVTDVAALLSVGVAAIGRPMAKSSALATHWLCEYLKRDGIKSRPVVVLGDNDPAGVSGAEDLAAELSAHFRCGVGWALPHKKYKDVREQINADAWSQGLRLRGLKVSDSTATTITTNRKGK